MLRYWTAGESHGKTLLAMIDGFPAGMTIDEEPINRELARRQGGYGRGGRQRIETDKVEVMTGVWKGMTLGSPIALQVINRDYKLERLEDLPRPRPGHGDLTGAIKYLGPIRAILERASARETAVRVAAGALAKQLLAEFDIQVYGFVDELGGIAIQRPENVDDVEAMVAKRDESIIYSLNPALDPEFKELIDKTGKAGDTLGGIVEVRVVGAPFGLGTHAQWERKLDASWPKPSWRCKRLKGSRLAWASRPHACPVRKCTIRFTTMPRSKTASIWVTPARPTTLVG